MPNYNKVVLAGHLTRDVQLRYIASGTAVADIGIAVNDRVKKGNEWVDETTFVDATVWGKTAEFVAEYMAKGDAVLVDGRLKLDTWEQDGQKRSKLKVVAEKVQSLAVRKESAPRPSTKTAPARKPAPEPVEAMAGEDTDIPF